MLTIEKTVLPSPEQWEIIIEGMRNPKNSWDKSDSKTFYNPEVEWEDKFVLGDNDIDLMRRLAAGGSVHAKYRRMIPVFVTINAPLYWWKEFDTYKVGTVANSCSTMHKIHAKEFTLDDFSCEHLSRMSLSVIINNTVPTLNHYRKLYNEADEELNRKDLTEEKRKHVTAQRKHYWWQMIQLLPSSYNQKRTVMLNYEVLVNIYRWRRDHKLDEWHTFCDWIEQLPYSELITGKGCASE